MDNEFCDHVYKEVNSDPCELCGKPSHKVDWALQTRLAKEWKEANPNAAYGGWWSI